MITRVKRDAPARRCLPFVGPAQLKRCTVALRTCLIARDQIPAVPVMRCAAAPPIPRRNDEGARRERGSE